MNLPNGNGKPRQTPALLYLGPVVVEKRKDIRRFRLIVRAYLEGVKSLRKAYILCLEKAKVWGVDESLVESWEEFRRAASVAETLFSQFYGAKIDLFVKLGEGMPWVGVTEHALMADELAAELIGWFDQPRSSIGPIKAGCENH